MSKEPRRLELSITQVVASALAAVAAAAASARLGVAGTFVGAGVVSVVATISSAVVGHSLRRTNERVRTVVKTHAELARDGQTSAERIPMLGRLRQTQPMSRLDSGEAEDRPVDAPAEDADAGTPPVPSTVADSDASDTDRTQIIPTAAGSTQPLPADRTDVAQTSPTGPDEDASLASRFATVRWKPVAAVCVLVFALAVLGITIIELVGGRSLHNLETGQSGGGTSISHVVSPGTPTRHRTPPPVPSQTPSSGPSSSPSSIPSGPLGQYPSASPSSTPSGRPSSSPSSVPSASGSPSP